MLTERAEGKKAGEQERIGKSEIDRKRESEEEVKREIEKRGRR